MAKYTAVLTAQNTNTYICDIVGRHDADQWFATAMVGGNFGTTGSVSFGVSPDNGVTIYTLPQYGTATPVAITASGAVNLASGFSNKNISTDQLKLYAAIGTATNPSVTITVFDNR